MKFVFLFSAVVAGMALARLHADPVLPCGDTIRATGGVYVDARCN